MGEEFVAVLDFGSQYAQLIARRVREQHVYCEILPCDIPADRLARREPRGIILSGGPASVYAQGAPRADEGIFRLGVPVLGLCYGMQLGCDVLGGRVTPAPAREYGRTSLSVVEPDPLFEGLPRDITVWMSHGDQVQTVSGDFQVLARTENCPLAAVRWRKGPFYGLQFHPEVAHTPLGSRIIANFLHVCGTTGSWRMGDYIERAVRDIRATVGGKGVVCGLSGGIDSSVVAALLHRAVGPQLTSIFVDNGVLRQGEAERVQETFRRVMGLNLVFVDARERFLARLAGVTDPEEKRKRIGHEFIEVFKESAKGLKEVEYLAQGTLYPDVIESRSPTGGPSAKIKSHHNVGGLPAELGFKLVEPLRFLFKDEVREIARELGLPDEIVSRQPFPGPGLAVRVIGEVTEKRLAVLRQADTIVQAEVAAAGADRKLWQWFAVLLPVQTVGVMGDERTYENVVAVRAVESTDGMTADWARLPYEVLERVSSRIINEVKGVNRVVYDVSSKPPATIEWE